MFISRLPFLHWKDLTVQQCLKLDMQCSPRWDLLVIVALSTAMRRAELLNCTWTDIDFEKQVINITAKYMAMGH
jgi:integrase